MSSIRETLQEVFCEVFDDPLLEITDEMDSNSLMGWDSLQHINLIVATEKAFKIRFNTSEIAQLKQPGENIGTFISLLESKFEM